MLSRSLAVLVVIACCAVLIAAPANAVFLQSTIRAELTNVRTFGGNASLDPFVGNSYPSTNIGVTKSPGLATFRILRTVDAPFGETASWSAATLWDENRLGSISFHYRTNWMLPSLSLQLVASELLGGSTVVWSTGATGICVGDVTINNINPNAYMFRLVVVPEPGSLVSLASLCGVGLLGLRRMRRSGK